MSDKYNCCCCLVAQLCPTLRDPMEDTCQAPLSMEFTRQEDWSELPFPSPGGLPNPEIELWSPALQVDSLPLSYLGSPTGMIKQMRRGNS